MQEIYANLGSAAWWFSAIIVALLVNLVSAYVKAPVDSLFGRFSLTWRQRNARSKQKFDSAVKRLVDSPQALTHTSELEFRYRSNSVVFFVFSTTFLLMIIMVSEPATLSRFPDARPYLITAMKIVAVSVGFLGFFCHIRAMQLCLEVWEARRILIANEGRYALSPARPL